MDLVARRHHVVDGDRLEVEQVGEHRPVLAAEVLAPSSTSERSSSCDSVAPASRRGLDAQQLAAAPCTNRLTNQTTGVARLQQRRQHVARPAARCGRRARRRSTFGVISENTRIANVIATRARAPSASSPSPNSRSVITAVSVAAAALIRLLPSRITPSSRSVCAEQRERELARRARRAARGASAGSGSPPSSPSRRSRRSPEARAAREHARACRGCRPSGAQFEDVVRWRRRGRDASAPQQRPRARTCCRGRRGTAAGAGEDPAQRHAAAPAVAPAAERAARRTSSQPSDREHVLVRERDRLAEQLLGEQRCRSRASSVSSTKPDGDQPEQVALERQQRRQSPSPSGSGSRRCSRFSRPISTSACSAATMNSA